MNADQEKEFALNLRTLIYLNAVYQGRFTQLNVLSQMGHPKFKLAELSKTKDCLADIANYLEALRNGDPVIRLMLGANQGGDAQHVYLMLNSVKTELSEMAQAAKRILLDPYYFDDPDKVSFLCSCSARQLYGQDNYARKFVELGSVLGESPVVIENFRRLSEQLTVDLSFIGKAIQAVKSNDIPNNFYEHLRFMTRLTPGLLKSQAHDIVQLVTALSGNFGFKESGFILLEAESWNNADFSPLEAGYWKAFDFGVEEALLWKSHEILDPGLAAEWHTAGFTPEGASAWLDVLFSPLLAIQWNNAGYDPRTAAVLVKKGYESPLQLPADATEDIINEAYQDFYEEALREQEELEKQDQAA